MNFSEIIASIQKKSFSPVYFLQGDEPFFIDQISDAIEKFALEEHEKDFNQTILYGKDIKDVDEIIAIAKKYPMMAERQVVMVKEAQNLSKTIEKIVPYIENPLNTTVLVFCYKYNSLRANSKLYKSLSKWIIFNSDKIKDYQLPQWIEKQGKEMALTIAPKEAILLSDFLGNDLSKIIQELEKLKILLKESNNVTSEIIEKNIGISKEYNMFELGNALSVKNYQKISMIANYAAANSKTFPMVLVTSYLYGYFSKIMKLHFAKNKTNDAELAKELKLHPFVVKEYKKAAANYPPKTISRIINELKNYDIKSKGVGISTIDDGELIKELLFKISH
ncbi:MAG: DNA polymerase III subunit delta [Bacteroidia bacterium]